MSADFVERLQLFSGVECPVLGRMGNVDHAGHDHVFAVIVVIIVFQENANGIRADLAVFVRYSQYFVAARLNSARFVGRDMTCMGSDNTLMTAQKRIDHSCIGLCSADKKLHPCPRGFTGHADLVPRRVRKRIESVAAGLHHICLNKALHDRRMRPLHIITGKREFCLFIRKIHRFLLTDRICSAPHSRRWPGRFLWRGPRSARGDLPLRHRELPSSQ